MTSADIVPKSGESTVKPVNFVNSTTGTAEDPICIMKLGKKQELNFTMVARKGTGR